MILSSESLDCYDRCERRYAFAQQYEPKLISPLGVLYAALESALLAPDDPEQAAKDETMRIAAQKEITLTEINKFTTVRHIGYLAGIIAVALRLRLGSMAQVQNCTQDGFDWKSALYETADGKRHRIELVSFWDDDRLRACAHSWRVIGELAALQSPLTLTTVVIGPHRGGRRHSAWAKGLLHPVNKTLRFAPRNAKKTGFNDSWTKVWREHEGAISTERWLAGMKQDGVLDDLILSREIIYKPDDNRMIAARKEMGILAEAMKSASENAPMRRSSCDETGRGACPFSPCCYSPTQVMPADLPQLYSSSLDGYA